MRQTTFEYTDTKLTFQLMGLCFLIFMIMLFGLVPTGKSPWTIPGLIAAIGIPLTIFLLNKKKIKKTGTVTINDSNAEFKLDGSDNKIEYSDIVTYRIEQYIGTTLNIKFKNGDKFKLQANSNFCDHYQFDAACQELKTSIRQFKSITNVPIIRKKSMFERVWMLPLLVILTTGLVGGGLFTTFYQGKKIPASLYTGIAVLIPMWTSYINARKKREAD